MEMQVVRIGALSTPVVVFDQAASDPDHWRNLGIGLDWGKRGEYYPGPRAIAPQDYLLAMSEPLGLALTRVFAWRGRVKVLNCFYSLATSAPDQLSLAQRVPHVDSYDPAQIAFVHYLCQPRFGGTAFYRQRSTGFERIGTDMDKDFEAALVRDFNHYGEPPAAYVDGSSPLFEQLHACPATYNRLIVFPGNQLHCADLAGVALDPDPARGRLTVAGFLRPVS